MTEVKNIDTIEGLNDYISMLNNKKLTQEQRQQLQKQIRETKNNIVAGNTQTGNGTVALDKSGKMNKTIDATFKRKKEMDRGASFTVADNARIKVSDSCNVDLKNPELKAKLANLKPGERITVGRSKGDGLSTQDPYRFDIPDAPTTVSREHLILEKIDGAGELRVFAQIILPLSKPVLATIGLLQLLDRWNNWNTASSNSSFIM